MTLEQLFQLYAPLAGLLALAFWTGVLSQRVKHLEAGADLTATLSNTVAALTSTAGSLVDAVKRLDRTTERLEERAHPRGPEMRSL